MTQTTLEIAQNLIARQSVTPEDSGCQEYIKNLLEISGFKFEHMDFEDTKNLWAVSKKNNSNDINADSNQPLFMFAGHTDVVPAGNLEKWNTPPFDPTIIDGHIYGRGAADMKGSIAAMITATNRFIEKYPDHRGQIAFLITSDEEGPYINGTVRVIEELIKREQRIDFALVGEPSSSASLGDVIKIGRRGSLTGWLTIHGIQGHVAYPHLAENAIHTAAYFLEEIIKIEWDQGNHYFPPTSLQITNIKSGEAGNIIPGEISIEFNFRFSTEYTAQGLMNKMQSFVDKHCRNSDIKWKVNGDPFINNQRELINATASAIKDICQIDTVEETTGGTSDGRFIAKTGAQIVELGPINKTIHQVNERVSIDDLNKLAEVYFLILKRLLVD